MNKWFKRKMDGEDKKSSIRVSEIDCEMLGEYQRLVNKVFENPIIWDQLSEDEKETFDEGRRVISDLHWFGWGKNRGSNKEKLTK